MFSRVVLAASFLFACAPPESGALPTVSEGPVTGHVQQFVRSGRTSTAFAELSVALTDATVGDPAIAPAAEVRMLGLAAPIAETARSRPLTVQVEALALTVWPALLAEPLGVSPRNADLLPRQAESADEYLARLCAGPLRTECGATPPEQRAIAVRAVAMRRADERMQAALATCLDCRTADQSWDRLGWKWASLDREATGYFAGMRRERTVTSSLWVTSGKTATIGL